MVKTKLKRNLIIALLILILISFISQCYGADSINKDYFNQLFKLHYEDPEYTISDDELNQYMSAYNNISGQNLSEKEKVKQAIKTVKPGFNESVIDNMLTHHSEALTYANSLSGTQGSVENRPSGSDSNSSDDSASLGDNLLSGLGSIVDGMVGVVFYFFKLIPLLGGKMIMTVSNFVLVGTEGMAAGMTIDKILFNEVPIVGIDFFEQVGDNVWNHGTINVIRQNVAIWYTSFRNLAVVGLAIMVLYVGIRMAISSVADEKAKYKKMLVDWFVSLLLLFVLHYIIVFVIKLNNTFVDVLKSARNGPDNMSNIVNEFGIEALRSVAFVKSFTFTFMYFMLCIMTFIFLVTYIKRMITIAFLIMIAPIITITYSIDKMGDGKSQALNKWFKEFVYNVLIQPFQCIIYLALAETSLRALADSATNPILGGVLDIGSVNLGTALICILMVIFVYQAEDIIKEIFHFESKSVAKTIGQAAMITTAVGLFGKGKNDKSSSSKSTKRKKEAPKTKDGEGNVPANTTENKTNPNSRTGTNNKNTSADDIIVDNRQMAAKVAKAVVGTGTRMLKGAARTSFKATGALMFIAAGAATGNLGAAASGLKANPFGKWVDNYDIKQRQKETAKAYRDEVTGKGIYEGIKGADEKWIRQHTKDLLNGDVDVGDYEKDYYNKMVNAKDFYVENGYSEEDAITQLDQDLAKIQNGYFGEKTRKKVYKGNARRNKNNRFNSNQ